MGLRGQGVAEVLGDLTWSGEAQTLVRFMDPTGRPGEWTGIAPKGLQDFPRDRVNDDTAWLACAKVLEMEVMPSAVALSATGMTVLWALRAHVEVAGGGAPALAAADGGQALGGRECVLEMRHACTCLDALEPLKHVEHAAVLE